MNDQSELNDKEPAEGQSLLNAGLNEAAIAEKRPSASRLNSIIHPHPERDFLLLYHEDETDDATNFTTPS